MAKSNYKTIDGLMRHLRSNGINIYGSAQKRKLIHVGYYHGYKGYRFNKTSSNRIPYNDFKEILALIEFDSSLKRLFYSPLMDLETALKNITLSVVLNEAKSNKFSDIFRKLFNERPAQPLNNAHGDIKKKLNLRNKIHYELAKAYDKNDMVQYFYNRDDNIPIWCIFEIINLGAFGLFLECLNLSTKLKLSDTLHLNRGFNTNGALAHKIIYAIKDLRNAVAHNNVVFDTRFKRANIDHVVSSCLENDTSIAGIQFNSIVDYLILVIYILNKIGFSKQFLKSIISDFEAAYNDLDKKIPRNVFIKIFNTNIRVKLIGLRAYVSG